MSNPKLKCQNVNVVCFEFWILTLICHLGFEIFSSMTRTRLLILGAVIVVLVGGIAVAATRRNGENIETITVEPRDVIHVVSVTGRVKPGAEAKLSFTRGGKVAAVPIAVGATVAPGDIVIRLEADELAAQVANAEASLLSARTNLQQLIAAREQQDAKMDELRQGTRAEELALAETRVTNAQRAFADTEAQRTAARAKAVVDLASIYRDVESTLQDASAKADDAIRRQLDPLFSDDEQSQPRLSFSTSDSQVRIDVETGRRDARDTLAGLSRLVVDLSADDAGRDAALTAAEQRLSSLRTFLDRVNDALSAAVAVPTDTLATYRTNTNTARANVVTALSNVRTIAQKISTQKANNTNTLATSDAAVTTAANAFSVAQEELRVKRAGATAEQLRSQEKAVEQARFAVASQEAVVAQSEAIVRERRAALAQATLRSPIAGTLTRLDAHLGESMTPNVVVAVIQSAGEFEVEAFVPEVDSALLAIDDTAEVTLDAYGSDTFFAARIVAVDPAETVVEGVATYKTTLHFVAEDPRIKSGMTANVEVETDRRTGVLAVPFRAVIRKEGGMFVRMEREGGDSDEVPVTLGVRGSDGAVEIVSGISAGDRVVVSGSKE